MQTVRKLAGNKISRKRSYLTILNMFGEIEKMCSKYINIKKKSWENKNLWKAPNENYDIKDM